MADTVSDYQGQSIDDLWDITFEQDLMIAEHQYRNSLGQRLKRFFFSWLMET